MGDRVPLAWWSTSEVYAARQSRPPDVPGRLKSRRSSHPQSTLSDALGLQALTTHDDTCAVGEEYAQGKKTGVFVGGVFASQLLIATAAK
jgi:hypothetical protein